MRSASLYMSYNIFVRNVVGVEIVEVDSSRDHATDSVQSVAPLRQRRQNIFFNHVSIKYESIVSFVVCTEKCFLEPLSNALDIQNVTRLKF